MAIYINGIGTISPQETRNNNVFLAEIKEYTAAFLPIAEPPYKEYIDPKELRRMSKVIRNGIVSARISLEDSKLKLPDAIFTGTGLGCAIDTEKFLLSMIDNKETLLTPTSFIQSTHNTIGGSIAIGLGCHNYNMTYVQRGFSFENAMQDALMMLNDGEIENALVGGFDEMTENHIKILQSTGKYQNEGFSNLELKKPIKSGTIAGQGSSFFVLEKQKTVDSYAQLKDLRLLYKPESKEETQSTIRNFIESNNLDLEDIDLVLMGYNGIQSETEIYDYIAESLFSNSTIAWFKHLSGEFYTASAFGYWVAAQVLGKQQLPEILLRKKNKASNYKNILLYNQFESKQHSLTLFSIC